jgi:hypothetical protein
MRLQAQRLQKRELNQMRGIDGEDVHMASAKAPKQKSKKRTHGDVEMADAEVRLLSPLCTHTCLRATHFLRRKLLLRSRSILLVWTASILTALCAHQRLTLALNCSHQTCAAVWCAGAMRRVCNKPHPQPMADEVCVNLQGDLEEEEPEVKVPKLDIPDLRQILKRQEEPRARGLFSAAEFIALDDGEDRSAEEAAAEDALGDKAEGAMDTKKVLNGNAHTEVWQGLEP